YIALLPKISLQKAGPLMAEALMRWEHPERGPQNPADFVPFAEKTGFITQLSNWVIDGSLAIAAQWEQRGMPLGISVNISPRDLGSPEFATYVVERLRAHRLRGNCLTLEVTEPTVIDASPIVKQNLDVLWRLGVKIAIDDFGSGFASLDELRSLPLSYIMIDRQYIRGLTADAASKIVVQSAIDIGHSLGVEVVAEGVETEQQLDELREMGCDQVQGFFVGKPLTNDEFDAWVKAQQGRFSVGGLKDAPVSAGEPMASVPGEVVELTLEAPSPSSRHEPADDLGGEEILLDLGPAPGGNDDIELAFDVAPDPSRR
ncbi:MAG: EAL domain-containing protein, partial [Burkholderiaceae bacterium]